MYIRDIKKFIKITEDLEQQRDDLNVVIQNRIKEIQEACHHPQQYIITDKHYVPGGYLDTAYTDYTPICTLCGARGETKTENHGTYG